LLTLGRVIDVDDVFLDTRPFTSTASNAYSYVTPLTTSASSNLNPSTFGIKVFFT